jgi:hypothetical protein
MADGGDAQAAPSAPRVHDKPPFSMLQLHGRVPWIVPVAGGLFLVLAVLARFDALPWDRPVTEWVVDQTAGLLIAASLLTVFYSVGIAAVRRERDEELPAP